MTKHDPRTGGSGFAATQEARLIRRLMRAGRVNEALAFAGDTALAKDPAILPGILACTIGISIASDEYRIAIARLAEAVRE